MILPASFYLRHTCDVARALLGAVLVHETPTDRHVAIITQTEAYHGYDDRASHAARGRTPRNTPMYDTTGALYIYLCYGIHWMLNITTMEPGFPGAVLLRGVWYTREWVAISWPGKLTKQLDITDAHRWYRVFDEDSPVRIYRGIVIPKQKIHTSARIGIGYAAESATLPWRYFLDTSDPTTRCFLERMKK